MLQDPRRNAGQLWLPGRTPVAVYVKRQLVPFGEYIPFRGLLSHITSLTALQTRSGTNDFITYGLVSGNRGQTAYGFPEPCRLRVE